METTERKMNVELLRRVQAHILEEPQRLFMADWIIQGEPGEQVADLYGHTGGKFAACGTAACIGGWAKVLSGYRHLHDGPQLSELLGLTMEQEDRLFYRGSWPEQFRLAYKDDGSATSAQVAAARIDHFIATEGRE